MANKMNMNVEDEPMMCSNGCGFFGNSATLNMCSKCYKDHLLSSQVELAVENAATDSATSSSSSSVGATTPTVMSISVTEVHAEDKQETVEVNGGNHTATQTDEREQVRKDPGRCHSCRKRVGLTGFKCRCGDVFCSLHRYSESHNCSFDYKAAGRLQIQKANPLVKADKVDKI